MIWIERSVQTSNFFMVSLAAWNNHLPPPNKRCARSYCQLKHFVNCFKVITSKIAIQILFILIKRNHGNIIVRRHIIWSTTFYDILNIIDMFYHIITVHFLIVFEMDHYNNCTSRGYIISKFKFIYGRLLWGWKLSKLYWVRVVVF